MAGSRRSRLLASALVALVLAGALAGWSSRAGPVPADTAAGARDETAPVPPRDLAAGKKLYVAKCLACHKADGSGGLKVTGNPTPDWRDAKRMADPKHDDAFLRDCIINGKVKSGMVSWKAQLKLVEIENLIGYIRTFSAPDSLQTRRKVEQAGGDPRRVR